MGETNCSPISPRIKYNKAKSNLAASGTEIKATYDTGDSLRGFAPLTYFGTAEQPDLTIVAKSLDDGNKTLSMYVIIDPRSTNTTGTTYKVYAGNYGDIVFDHWNDGNRDKIRTLTIDKSTTIIAYYDME